KYGTRRYMPYTRITEAPMPFSRPALLVVALLSIPVVAAQQPSTPPAPQRDPQALAILQRSLTAMGGRVPADSVAIGTIALVEGSTRQTGTIRMTTRGLDQTSEQIDAGDDHRRIVFSNHQAVQTMRGSEKQLSMEMAAASRSYCFPLLLVASGLQNLDYTVQYVGLESLGISQVHHVHIWETFSAKPKLLHLAD